MHTIVDCLIKCLGAGKSCVERYFWRMMTCFKQQTTMNTKARGLYYEAKNISTTFQSDILSKLIEKNLNNIVEDIFFMLNENDISNVIAANPHWIKTLNTNRWLRLYSENRQAFKYWHSYRNALMQRKGDDWDEIAANQLFKQIVSDYSEAVKRRVSWETNHETFEISIPRTPFTYRGEEAIDSWTIYSVITNEEYIAVSMAKSIVSNINEQLERRIYLLLLYNRWTLQLANSLTVVGHVSNIALPEGKQRMIFIKLRLFIENEVFLWDLKTGKMHTLKIATRWNLISFDYLIFVADFIIEIISESMISVVLLTVYNGLGLVTRKEQLGMMEAKFIPSDETLNYFGLVGKNLTGQIVYQIRAKHDFALMRIIPIEGGLDFPEQIKIRFLLDYCFGIFTDEREKRVQVLSLDKDCRVVYNLFCFEPEWDDSLEYLQFLVSDGLLALSDGYRWVASTKLPPEFANSCRTHMKHGTIGSDLKFRIIDFNEKRTQFNEHELFNILHCDGKTLYSTGHWSKRGTLLTASVIEF